MKKILIFLFALFVIISCKNDKDFYLSQDHKSVFKRAPKDDKKIFIDFYTTWCGSCKGYDNFIFPDSSFIEYLKTDFYSLKLNAELPENKTVANKYKITGYPTIIIANPDGTEIDRIIGFKSEQPEYYIDLIENILTGKENLDSFKVEFLKNTENAEYAKEIITKLFQKEDYQSIENFIQLVKTTSKNETLLNEADLFLGFAKLRNRQSPNPSYLENRLNSDKNLDDYWKENILSELIGYYKNVNIDTYEYYCYELEKNYPMNFYWNRQFARYLYENNKDLETANRITNNMAVHNKLDHWTPFLQGHQLALQGKKEEAFDNFDNWMIKYKNLEDSKNRYYFYIVLAVYHNYRLEKALQYAVQLEEDIPSIHNRKQLAKLYYLTNQQDKAVEILKETIPLIETAKEKKEIDKMIDEYSI